ncbi:GEVED domain-containing protein [Flavobacterium sp. PLA-1-15]|uniref:GEVED domain-containing protein n=1 Tax=Flavobacterium sp. PLA-1-15 TaxID=3380533 RepID=UPI003B7F120D
MKKNYFSTRNPFPQLNQWLGWLTVLMLLFGQVGYAQMSYSYDWPTSTNGWTASGGYQPTSIATGACGGSGFSFRVNLYNSSRFNTVRSSAIQNTNGGDITFSFDYKVVGYANIATATSAANVGTIKVEYATSTSGPWTSVYQIDSSNHNPSSDCANKTFSFSGAPASGDLYFRFNSEAITTVDGDGYWYYFDNVVISQGPAPSCFAPSGIVVTPMPYTATINWNPVNNGDAYNWIVVADNAGSNGAVVASGNGTNVSGLATGLAPSTAYDLYVKTDCGEDGPSNWSPKIDFTTLVACAAPTAGIASGVTLSEATLGWTSTGAAFEINWGTGTFLAGEGPNTETAVSGTAFALDNLAPNTTYRWFVRQDCTATSDGMSTWAGPFTFFTGYCVPSSTSALTFINNFSTAGAMTNISNLASGYTTGGYQNNYDTAGMTHFAGGTFSITSAITGGTAGLNVWVDWNNNYLFEDSERIYMSNGYINAVTNGNVTLPSNVALGEYRMRVRTDYNATNPSPCSNTNTRTEAEDYKFTIVAQPQDAVTWANLQAFVVGGNAVTAMQPCQTVDVYTQAWDEVATQPDGANPDLKVWIGRYSENTDPATWPESAFTLATYNIQANNNDEYKVTYATLPAGNQYFVARYKLGFGPYRYGASNNGFWNEETNPAALLTVGMPVINVTASQTGFCVTAEPVTINISSENPNYVYTINGVATTGTEVVTPAATTTYTVVGTDSVTGCTLTNSIKITVSENLTPATISYSDAAMCVGSVQELSISGGKNTSTIVSGIGGFTSTPGSATPVGPNPFQNYYGGNKQQWIYKAQELLDLGFAPQATIQSIALNMVATNGVALQNVVVKMKNTAKQEFEATGTLFETDLTVVKNAASHTPTVGQNVLTLDTPFEWDGVSNLIIEINYSNNDAGPSPSNTAKYSATSFRSTYLWRVDNQTAAIVNANLASMLPAATGSLTSFSSRVDITFNVGLQGNVTWSPATDLYTDAEATVPYVANTVASKVYTKPTSTVSYVANVANAFGCSVSSASQEFTLLPVVDLPAVPATALELCPTATVADLLSEVTGTDVQIYGALTGGVALASTANLIEGSYYASQTVGGCESARAELVIMFSTPQLPNFALIGTICEGSVAPTLATTSPNGIEGTWAPALIDNMASGSYVFTPNAGICALPQTLDVTVSSTPVAPDFASALSFCSTDLMPILTTTSPNGIIGTWNPAVVNTDASGTYTFTPNEGQCGSVHELVVTITTALTPDFANITICSGATAPELELTSPNGISGSWSPDVIDTAVGGDYLFTPDAGVCANAQTITVTVNPIVAPNFDAIDPICIGDVIPALELTSPNGITGTWTPAVIDTTTSGIATYIFLPDAGQCAVTQSITVTVNEAPLLVITNPDAVCAGSTVDLTAASITAGSGAGLTFSQWADPFGTVSFPNPDAVASSGTFYIKAENASGCSVMLPVIVTVKEAVDAPTTANATQDFTTGDDLSDFDVTGTDLIWYDASTDGNVLASSTAITAGSVYYVSQTVDGCESATRLMITAGVDLKTSGFDSVSLKYYPNPVSDVLTITYSNTIENVEVFNVLGQKVYQKAHNSQEVKIDMSSLATGNYIVNVMANGLVKNIKVIKK